MFGVCSLFFNGQNLLLETVWMEGDFGTPGEAPITVIDLSNNINLTTLDIDFLRNITDLILPVTPTLTDIYLILNPT